MKIADAQLRATFDDKNRMTELARRDDETVTVPVLLNRVLHEDQRKQVQAILQNRPSGDRAQDAASPLGAEFDPLPETTGPDVIER